VIHPTTASHASQEITRSARRMTREFGKAAVSTLADKRITANDSKTGITILNSAIGTPITGSRRRAA
jgi:hypothetical protein